MMEFKPETIEEQELWKNVYIAAIQSGVMGDMADSKAYNAIRYFRAATEEEDE